MFRPLESMAVHNLFKNKKILPGRIHQNPPVSTQVAVSVAVKKSDGKARDSRECVYGLWSKTVT